MAVSGVERKRGAQAQAAPGRRRAPKVAQPRRLAEVGVLTAGVVVAVVAWMFLVLAAIDFGRLARADGQVLPWVFTGAATLGATVCLVLAFVLVMRVLLLVGLVSDYRPRRSAGRRAAR